MSSAAMKPCSARTSPVTRTWRLHAWHRTRARRWATMQSTEDATRKGSTPISIRRLSVDAASLVCSVESTRWPVMAASMEILAVSWSDLADEDDVGVRAQDRAQAGGEGQPGLGVHLDLRDAVEL